MKIKETKDGTVMSEVSVITDKIKKHIVFVVIYSLYMGIQTKLL